MDRRTFIKSATLSGSYVLLLSRGMAGGVAHADDAPGSDLGFFTPLERIALGDLCDTVFEDATELGAVQYIETLLTAFDSHPPKIYAGGPFSGRGQDPKSPGPFQDNFKNFLPLNRYQEAAWRLQIYGEAGIPGGSPNAKTVGAQKGLRNIIKEGVQQSSLQMLDSGVVVKSLPALVRWTFLSAECKKILQNLTVEACLSAPEYGGNSEQAGWKRIHYEGDRAPYGYSHFDEATQSYREDADAPVSTSNPGPDPEPLSFGVKMIFNVVSTFAGKVFY